MTDATLRRMKPPRWVALVVSGTAMYVSGDMHHQVLGEWKAGHAPLAACAASMLLTLLCFVGFVVTSHWYLGHFSSDDDENG